MSQTDTSSDKKNDALPKENVVKWLIIVFGVIAVLLIFKKQVAAILDRTTELKVTKDGVEIKSAITPLGETEITAYHDEYTSTAEKSGRDTVYINKQYKFMISWPLDNDWFATESKAISSTSNASTQIEYLDTAAAHTPISIVKGKNKWKKKPNISVTVVKSDGDIASSMNTVLAYYTSVGWQIYLAQIDEDTQSGIIVFKNPESGGIIQIQRVIIADEYSYIITSTNIPPGVKSNDRLKEELRDIMNSFRLIES